jgi:hypothetical protein
MTQPDRSQYTLDDVPERIRRATVDAEVLLGELGAATIAYAHKSGQVEVVTPVEAGARCPIAHQVDGTAWGDLVVRVALANDAEQA